MQSLQLPTVPNGAHGAIYSSGTATSEGLLTRSSDGQFMVIAGYSATNNGSSLAGSSSVAVPRVVARISASGTVDTRTLLTDWASANNPRSAVTSDGTQFWLGGAAGGVRWAALAATTSTKVSNFTPTDTVNIRQVNIFGGQLYASSQSGNMRLGSVGVGLPTTLVTPPDPQNLPGITNTTPPNPYCYFFADLNPGVSGPDTLYVADETNTVGVMKFSLVGGTWVSSGNCVVNTGDNYRRLAGTVSGTTVTLFAVRRGGSGAAGGGELVSFADNSGYNGAFAGNTPSAVLATAAVNRAFRGIAMAPVAAVPPEVIVSTMQANLNEFGSGTTAIYTLRLSTTPESSVTIRVTPGASTRINGGAPGAFQNVLLNSLTPVTITVDSIDDNIVQGTHNDTISHTITSGAPSYPVAMPINSVTAAITDNEFALLNKIKANPAGTDGPNEYVEIQGSPNATIANMYLVSISGEDGNGPGTANLVVDLNNPVIGGNGLL